MANGLSLRIRPAARDDLDALDLLFARTFTQSLKSHYPPSVIVTALPLISKAQPALLQSESYFVAERGGRIVAAGGWTQAAPSGRPGRRGVGHIRHVVTDLGLQRQGIGRALMSHIIVHAHAHGMTQLHCQSTRNAVRFYTSMGFVPQGEIEVDLRPGISFPAVFMVAQLV